METTKTRTNAFTKWIDTFMQESGMTIMGDAIQILKGANNAHQAWAKTQIVQADFFNRANAQTITEIAAAVRQAQ